MQHNTNHFLPYGLFQVSVCVLAYYRKYVGVIRGMSSCINFLLILFCQLHLNVSNNRVEK